MPPGPAGMSASTTPLRPTQRSAPAPLLPDDASSRLASGRRTASAIPATTTKTSQLTATETPAKAAAHAIAAAMAKGARKKEPATAISPTAKTTAAPSQIHCQVSMLFTSTRAPLPAGAYPAKPRPRGLCVAPDVGRRQADVRGDLPQRPVRRAGLDRPYAEQPLLPVPGELVGAGKAGSERLERR